MTLCPWSGLRLCSAAADAASGDRPTREDGRRASMVGVVGVVGAEAPPVFPLLGFDHAAPLSTSTEPARDVARDAGLDVPAPTPGPGVVERSEPIDARLCMSALTLALLLSPSITELAARADVGVCARLLLSPPPAVRSPLPPAVPADPRSDVELVARARGVRGEDFVVIVADETRRSDGDGDGDAGEEAAI